MTLGIKNLTLCQQQAILEDLELTKPLYDKTLRNAIDIAEDVRADASVAVDEIENRLKGSLSFLSKCDEKGFRTPEEARAGIKDRVGVRIITRYIDKIMPIFEYLSKVEGWGLSEVKDYLNNPKENGYRGYHAIFQKIVNNQPVYIEVQIRTMAQHLWASIEHILRYKNPSLEISELKNKVFREISDKLNEIDNMIVELRENCKPDTVVIEIPERDKLATEMLKFATEATLAMINSEASQSLPPLPKAVRAMPNKKYFNTSGKPLFSRKKKKNGKKKKHH